MEAPLRNKSEVRYKRTGVLNTVEGMWEEREGRRQRSTLFVVVVNIDADYEDVGHPECMSISYVFIVF